MERNRIDELLTRNELTRILKLCGRSIDRLLKTGELPMPIKVGKSFRWRQAEIAEYIRLAGPSASGQPSTVNETSTITP